MGHFTKITNVMWWCQRRSQGKSLGFIFWEPQISVQNVVPIPHMLRYITSIETSQGIAKIIRIHPLKNTNMHTKFHLYNPKSHAAFLSNVPFRT